MPEHGSEKEEQHSTPENHENTLCPNCGPENNLSEEPTAEEGEQNPFKRALQDNEAGPGAFVDELKAAADARKK